MSEVIKNLKTIRKKLDKSIRKYGIYSENSQIISKEFDDLLNVYYKSIKEVEFPESSMMIIYYRISYNALKELTQKNKKFPLVKEWNKYAKENKFMSHISLEYISKLDWNYIQIKVEREINLEIL
ncbi:MAG: hypothetical protein ACLTPN_04770 [Clostridia bacterium]